MDIPPPAARRAALLLVALVAAVITFVPAMGGRDRVGAAPDIDPTELSEVPVRGGWGVVNFDAGAKHNFENLVWDFAQIGDRMFVAGSFLDVTNSRHGERFRQPYLAAFDIAGGEWVSDFAPQLDGPVFALEVSPLGFLIAGGQFTSLAGEPHTAGLVGIDPVDGSRDDRFQVSLQRPWSPEPAIARQLEVVGDDLYVAGNFSHVRGNSDTQRRRLHKVARVDARWGTPDGDWNPVISGGGVWGMSVDAARDRIHVSGIGFTVANGQLADRLATFELSTGELTPGQAAVSWNHTAAKDIWDVEVAGSDVWTAGTEHLFQRLDGDGRTLVGYHTTGLKSDGYELAGFFAGGDYQVAHRIGGWVFAGCHCTYEWRNANGYAGNTWYDSFSDARHPIRLVGAVDIGTGRAEPGWSPDLAGSSEGVWAIGSDSLGCLWVGGQFDVAGVEAGAPFWVGNFARFCPPDAPVGPDTTSPSAPTGLQATVQGDEVELVWEAASDDRGVVAYVIDRDGEEIATVSALTYTDSGPDPGWHDYKVKAVDAAGNRSGNSNVVSVLVEGPDVVAPSVPAGLAAEVAGSEVSLVWEPSVDDVGVWGYAVYRGGAYVGWAWSASFVDEGVPDGSYGYQVRAYDAAGNRSDRSAVLEVTVGAG